MQWSRLDGLTRYSDDYGYKPKPLDWSKFKGGDSKMDIAERNKIFLKCKPKIDEYVELNFGRFKQCGHFDDLLSMSYERALIDIPKWDKNRNVPLVPYLLQRCKLIMWSYINQKKDVVPYKPRSKKLRYKTTTISHNPKWIESIESKVNICKNYQIKDSINNYLNILPERQRQILIAHYLMGYTLREIAKQENCSHQNINKIIKNSLNRIKKKAEIGADS